jgi:hypothetical protein
MKSDKHETFSTEDEHNDNNRVYQITDLKYVTFDNEVDELLKREVTIDSFLLEIETLFEQIVLFRKEFSSFVITNSYGLKEKLQEFHLNYMIFNIKMFLMERQVPLISYVIKLKYEKRENPEQIEVSEIKKILDRDYRNKDFQELMLQWTEDELFRHEFETQKSDFNSKSQSVNDNEDLVLFQECFQKGIKDEKFILSILENKDFTPGLTTINAIVLYFKMLLKRSSELMKVSYPKDKEEYLMDFLETYILLKIVLENVKKSLRIPSHDIFNIKESSQEWEKLKKNYERHVRVIKLGFIFFSDN